MNSLFTVALLFKAIDAVTAPVRKINDALGSTGKEANKAAARMDALLKKTEQLGKSAEKIRMNNQALRQELQGSMLGTGAAVVSVSALLKPSINYESAMADVSKVVDFASKEEEKLFARAILDRSKVIPVAAEGLAQIAAAGGSLGIAKDKLLDFTTVVSKISTAFGMSAEQSGDAIAKIMNVYGLSVKEAERLGDAINQLGNTTAAKEKDIVDVLSRVGGAGKMFGLAGKEVAALATGFLALGRPPEMAGTAINALLTKLNTADKQGKKFQQGLAAIGTSGVELKNAIEKNPQKALTDFLDKMKAIPKKDQMGILTDLFGMEYSDDIALLLTGLEQYKTALKETATETKFAGSMQKEFETRSKTTANQLQLLKNTMTAGAINLGNLFLPGLNSALSVLRPLTEVLGNVAGRFPTLTKVVGGLVVGLVAMKVASIGGRYAFILLKDGAALALSSCSSLLKGLRIAIMATRAFSVALFTTPIGWVIMGITAIAVSAYLIHKYWTPIKTFFKGLWTGILGWLQTLPVKMLQAGKNIINSIYQGMMSMINKPVELLKTLAQKLRNLLPFSPAKDGPLKDIHKIRLIETIAETVRPAPLVKAMKTATAAAMIAVTPVMPAATADHGAPVPLTASIRQAAPSTATIHFSPQITIQGGNPEQIKGQVQEAINLSFAEFERLMQRYEAQKSRRSFT